MRELLLLCLVLFDGFHLARSAQTAFNPNSLAVETRLSWCTDQMNSCAELCAGPGLGANSCDHVSISFLFPEASQSVPDWMLSHCWLNSGADPQSKMTLNYACTCANGTAPGLPYYARTMPTFICEQNKKDCIADAKGDAAAEKECGGSSKSACGTLDPMSATKKADDKPTTTATATGKDTTSTATSTSKSDSTESSSSSSGGGGEGGGKPSVGWLAAVVAGVLIFVGALAGGFYWLGKRRSRNKKRKSMMAGTDGETGDDSSRTGPYKTLSEGQGGSSSQWSVYELHTTKEIPAEMDSLQPSPVVSELPSPGASHFVAELDGRMVPSVTRPGATYNQDDGRKYRMPDEGR
ncbi:hypothetical protein PG985_012866 [Apiospora marii]|uniref:uncharacterized protein n=1 Tax=Apiospora marii TaxID=335849 RepID=UPI003130C989